MIDVILKKGIKRTKVVIYSDIENMPINRFSKFNKYLMIESNVGSDLSDFTNNHLAKIYRVAGDKDKTITAANNLRQLFEFIIKEVNVTSLAFGVLVYSINGEGNEDLTEETLKNLVVRLGNLGLTNQTLKKKLKKYRSKRMRT